MRVYLPVTFPDLARAGAAGEFGPAPLFGYAVTPALREWYASGDAEELEYAAMTDAARECLRLLARDPSAPPRRVVVAADVDSEDLSTTPDLHPGAVIVNSGVVLSRVASVHVDDPAATADVAAAVRSIHAADGGDPDAQFAVDGVEDHELQWYATQEIPHLLND